MEHHSSLLIYQTPNTLEECECEMKQKYFWSVKTRYWRAHTRGVNIMKDLDETVRKLEAVIRVGNDKSVNIQSWIILEESGVM